MISAIQSAGMVLIVKIILMLITGTRFVNGQCCGVQGSGCELRVAGPSISDLARRFLGGLGIAPARLA